MVSEKIIFLASVFMYNTFIYLFIVDEMNEEGFSTFWEAVFQQ